MVNERRGDNELSQIRAILVVAVGEAAAGSLNDLA